MELNKTFVTLQAWQKAHEFVLAFYKTKKYFPSDEKYALIPQFQRAATSIAANISEGFGKISPKDKLKFYNIAQGSLEECRYFIILCKDLGYYTDEIAEELWKKLTKASVVLNSYCNAISQDINSNNL